MNEAPAMPVIDKVAHTHDTVVNLTPDTRHTLSGQYFCTDRPFAYPKLGNKVTILNSGQEVFEAVQAAIEAAKHLVCIADWQMAFDVELSGRATAQHHGRLWFVIEQLVKSKPVRVQVLLYRSPADFVQPGTKDGMVMDRLYDINKKGYPGRVEVNLQSATSSQIDNLDYSHHQKFIVVDGKVAILGGIDLTYGRWETPNFDVVIDPALHVINDMYNPCMAAMRGVSPDERKLIDEFDFAKPYGSLLEEGCTPRMPWQDVQVRFEGPAAVDVFRNFSRRWNASLDNMWFLRKFKNWVSNTLPERITSEELNKIGVWDAIKNAQKEGVGQAEVQIVRSVSNHELKLEGKSPEDLALIDSPTERSVMEYCLDQWQGQHQDNIRKAMLNCIRNARSYVYIETQFFISAFGTWAHNGGKPYDSAKHGNESSGIQNGVLDALAQRVIDHIQAGLGFHVYLVIPVHPEGPISSGMVYKQHVLGMASIKHGSQSLIRRIQAALKSKGRAEDDWVQYLTVLNMRNHGVTVQYARDPKTNAEDFSRELGRYVITEQIYIHSKMMIVDDAVAIIGTANTNDRSLSGNGDSEIAAVIVDNEGVEARDLGNGVKVSTRKFARELRQSLWRKHLGLMVTLTDITSDTGYFYALKRATRKEFSPPADLPSPPRNPMSDVDLNGVMKIAKVADLMSQPCGAKTVAAIQALAISNAAAYERVFLHTPRDAFETFEEGGKHWTLSYPMLTVSAEELAFEEQANEGQRRYRPPSEGVVPPPLQAAFMTNQLLPHQQAALQESDPKRKGVTYPGGHVHDVARAIKALRDSVHGFWIAAPLDWGMKSEIKGSPDKFSTVDVAASQEAGKSSQPVLDQGAGAVTMAGLKDKNSPTT
ncbi:MAG: hypothetical protein RI907_196 [Pseudomonadota bacterium]|jgi:phospholipase D1/2